MANPTIDTIKANVATILSGLSGGAGKSALINAEREGKKVMLEVAKTIEAAKVYLTVTGKATLTQPQLDRLVIWYRKPADRKPLSAIALVTKFKDVSDAMLIELLKARGYRKISK